MTLHFELIDLFSGSPMECGVIPHGIHIFPWLVSVVPFSMFGQPNYLLDGACGGSFISNQHVITAGHCVEEVGAIYYIIYNGHAYEAEVVSIAPNCEQISNDHTDMAILRLTKIPDEYVTPICLPSKWTNNLVLNDSILTMASFRGGYHKKSIPVIDGACYDHKNQPTKERKINKTLSLSLNVLFSEYLTIGGDSGSPLMRKNNEDIWTLIAIVRGTISCGEVEDSVYQKDSVYQTIFPWLSWVFETVNECGLNEISYV